MHLAAIYDQKHIVELLHEMGADIEATNNHHMTPIHYSARSNDVHTLKFLIEKGANIHHTDKFNATVRHYSASAVSREWVGAVVVQKIGQDEPRRSVLFAAFLTRAVCCCYRQALTHAAQKGHEDPAHHLLHAGAKHDHKSWDHVHKVHRTVREWGHHKNRPEISETIDRFLERAAEL
jgi:hypothetical protein